MTKLEQYDYAGATAQIAVTLLAGVVSSSSAPSTCSRPGAPRRGAVE